MPSAIRSILLLILGLLLGFGAAILLFRPPAIYSHALSPKAGTASVTPGHDKALAVEDLACEVGLNYSVRLMGTVKNLGDRTVDGSNLSISGNFPPPYSPLFIGYDVSLPQQLKPGELASFEIRKQLSPPVLPTPPPKSGDFVGRITVRAGNNIPTVLKVQACWFKTAVPPPPGPPAECEGRLRYGSAYRWKDGECGAFQAFRLRWLNPQQALLGDPDRPVLLVFSAPPQAVNSIWVVRDGSFPYMNSFSAKINVPRLRVLSAPGEVSSQLGPLPPERR
jgi:hypothetical protein